MEGESAEGCGYGGNPPDILSDEFHDGVMSAWGRRSGRVMDEAVEDDQLNFGLRHACRYSARHNCKYLLVVNRGLYTK
jgi:hypothetical protein